jgi:hypothetical protein
MFQMPLERFVVRCAAAKIGECRTASVQRDEGWMRPRGASAAAAGEISSFRGCEPTYVPVNELPTALALHPDVSVLSVEVPSLAAHHVVHARASGHGGNISVNPDCYNARLPGL